MNNKKIPASDVKAPKHAHWEGGDYQSHDFALLVLKVKSEKRAGPQDDNIYNGPRAIQLKQIFKFHHV